MSPRSFAAQVSSTGKVTLQDRPGFDAACKRLAGKRVLLTVEAEKDKRSVEQNRWYWGSILREFSEYSGYEVQEAHDLLRAMFLATEKALPDGRRVRFVRSTTDLNTQEFSEYCEQCRRFLASHGVNVPDPGR